MRILFLLSLFLFAACSGAPVRKVAALDSDNYYGAIDYNQSSVKLFTPELDSHTFRYFFYLELKDSSGAYVDIDESEISVKLSHSKIKPKINRILRGRYYVTLENHKELPLREIKFRVRGKVLKEKFNLSGGIPDQRNTSLTIVSKESHRIKLRLRLLDSKGAPVRIQGQPEFVLEGNGTLIEGLKQSSEGIWEFEVLLPDYNQIIYVSVRAQGIYFNRMLRIQHIEM